MSGENVFTVNAEENQEEIVDNVINSIKKQNKNIVILRWVKSCFEKCGCKDMICYFVLLN